MDCKLFESQMRQIAVKAQYALKNVEAGDSKRASFFLDEIDEKVREARENLGKVGA